MLKKAKCRLPSGWYVVGTPESLAAAVPTQYGALEWDWVLWRNASQQWILQADRCPHRGARLSQGSFSHRAEAGKCLTCPFHGFEFDSSGECVHVPETGKAAPGLKVRTISLVEKHGFLWMPWRSPASTSPDIWFEDLSHPGFRYGELVRDWEVHLPVA